MPWSNQNGGGGGPWGGGGGGNNQGPWGQGPNRPRGGNNGGPPDLEDIIRRGQDRLKNIVPGGFNGGVFVILALVLVVFWLIQAVYTVQPDERGVELRFGKPKEEISMPGLHFHIWPLETVEIVKVTEQQQNIGANASTSSSSGLMLTGDQNIVNVQFSVLFTVSDPRAYLFRMADNLMHDRVRAAMRRTNREHAWGATGYDNGELDDSPSAERALDARQRLRRVERALATLGERSQTIFRRFRIDGVAQGMIAQEEGISVSAVEKHLQRAYRIVATLVDEDSEITPPAGPTP